MRQSFFVPGPLPSMNEMIAAAKGYNGRGFAYAKMKQEWTTLVAQCATAANLTLVLNPVAISCQWNEKHRRRDIDNVQAGVKFVLDGLVQAGILVNDTQAKVWQLTHSIVLDKTHPGVWVEIDS